MTTQTMISAAESSMIGAPSDSTSSSPSLVFYKEFATTRPLPLPNTVALGALVRDFEMDGTKAEHLARARQNLSAMLYEDEPDTLSAIRLSAGLSQNQLAERINTSQSYIARLESGRNDPGTDMVARIANALGVDEAVAFLAIRKQIATRGQGV